MEFDLKNVKEFEPNTIFLEDGQFLENYKNGNIDLTDGLPNGILDKRYTGVGATTVEIKSSRKSIIVFPFRKLALEKFEKYKKTRTVFYVGTDKNSKSKSINDIKKFASANSDENIKFLVVADSIDKVIEGIKKANQDPYKEYFMTLDEVEILQMQSGFRSKLPLCFDYFKKFERKCFVSATLLTFTDEDLLNLPKYQVVKYKSSREEGYVNYKEPLKVRFVDSEFPHLALSKLIVNYFKSYEKSNQKLFIGLNSIQGIKQLTESLEESGVNDISVICSESSSDQFKKKYNTGEIKEGILPSIVNIATCVAWSGIDISEPCLSIAVSLNSELHHSFSFENIVQFFGRCRLMIDKKPKSYFFLGTRPELNKFRDAISVEKRSVELKELLLYINENLSSKIDRESVLESLCETKNSLFYKDINGDPNINFLLNDLDIYRNQIIDDYDNKCKNLLKNLESHYNLDISDKIGFSEIKIPENENDKYKVTNLLELIDNFDLNFPENRLVEYIKKSKKSTFKVAAFWYLFGRNILNNHDDGKAMATFFTEIKSNNYINVTKICIDSIYLYYNKPEVWKKLKNDLLAVNKKGKPVPAIEFYKVFTNQKYKSFFTSLKNTRDVNHFIDYFLGTSPQSTSNNKNKYLLNKKLLDNPSLLKKFPSIDSQMEKIPTFLPDSKGVKYSYKNNATNLFGEIFEKEK